MKKAKCFKCDKVLKFNPGLGGHGDFVLDKRDKDGLDIFICGCPRTLKFKVDVKHYMENRGKGNFIAKTVDAYLDYSDGIDKKPKKVKGSSAKKVLDFFGF